MLFPSAVDSLKAGKAGDKTVEQAVADRCGRAGLNSDGTNWYRHCMTRIHAFGDDALGDLDAVGLVDAMRAGTVSAGELKDQPAAGKGTAVFVELAPNRDGFYEAVSVHQEPVPVTLGEVLIHGRVIGGSNCGGFSSVFCERLQIRYGIESYFVPEGEGRAIESARNEGKVAIVAAVTGSGRAAIKRLLIDGKPVYDEPAF